MPPLALAVKVAVAPGICGPRSAVSPVRVEGGGPFATGAPLFAGTPTSIPAALPTLRATALATGEQALSMPSESTAATATKYRFAAKSPVSLNVTTSLLCGLRLGDVT